MYYVSVVLCFFHASPCYGYMYSINGFGLQKSNSSQLTLYMVYVTVSVPFCRAAILPPACQSVTFVRPSHTSHMHDAHKHYHLACTEVMSLPLSLPRAEQFLYFEGAHSFHSSSTIKVELDHRGIMALRPRGDHDSSQLQVKANGGEDFDGCQLIRLLVANKDLSRNWEIDVAALLQDFLLTLTHVEVEWLITGKGSKFAEGNLEFRHRKLSLTNF